jgi:APA family basic amino acid/polyamine antiporter
MLLRRLFRTKSIDSMLAEREEAERGWKRVLGARDLIVLGIGGIIGAGIFASIGTAIAGDEVRLGAGPALLVSFVLTGTACALAGLCYAELASLVPVSGSAYTYAYATLGELLAWIIGWDLILEYAVGNVAVAVSWSGYFCEFVNNVGTGLAHTLGMSADYCIEFPRWLATDLRTALEKQEILDAAPRVLGTPVIFNLPAVLIVAGITALLVIGIRESARFTTVMVIIKLLALGFFVVVAGQHFNPENWVPFAPNGWSGIQSGAAVMFFAFIGFDAVSTTAEECRDPKRDLPIGILGSLAICTVIYVIVGVVVTGAVRWDALNTAEPLATVLKTLDLPNAAGIVSLGSLVAHTAVLLVFQLGQARILCVMARDGLLPRSLAKTHGRFKTPYVATIVTGLFVGVGSAVASLDEMADLCNIGTLSAFLIACIGVLVLRSRDPDRPRGFRTPWVPTVPVLGVVACLYLMLGLPWTAWRRFGVWLVIGLVCYGLYGFWRSRLNAGGRR